MSIPRWAAQLRAECERCQHRFNVHEDIEWRETLVACPQCKTVAPAVPEPFDHYWHQRIIQVGA